MKLCGSLRVPLQNMALSSKKISRKKNEIKGEFWKCLKLCVNFSFIHSSLIYVLLRSEIDL